MEGFTRDLGTGKRSIKMMFFTPKYFTYKKIIFRVSCTLRIFNMKTNFRTGQWMMFWIKFGFRDRFRVRFRVSLIYHLELFRVRTQVGLSIVPRCG